MRQQFLLHMRKEQQLLMMFLCQTTNVMRMVVCTDMSMIKQLVIVLANLVGQATIVKVRYTHRVNIKADYLDFNDLLSSFFIFLFSDYECYEAGSLHGNVYDQTTGSCTCKKGWIGDKCQGSLKLNIKGGCIFTIVA